ncbi:hypothetical protein ACFWXO_13550 [Kitasatospora sp. NPDC059088]|uniref:hypothetical protein n=1 Tax=Kitasatospora sp. NPDC059088 TaxID=3346722 RepID=UPI00368D994B
MNPTTRPQYTTVPPTPHAEPIPVRRAGHPLNSGARWLLHGQDLQACTTAWQTPHGQAPIEPGAPRYWDAIRVHARLGDLALHHLAVDHQPGPVLDTGADLVFLVPALFHDWNTLLTGITVVQNKCWNWGRSLTAHLGPNSAPLPCPQPGIPHRKGARWLVEPDGSGTLTFTGQLAVALHTAYPAAIAPTHRPPAQTTPEPQAAQRQNNLAAFFKRPHPQEAS